jgi:hypothetical protein
MSLILLGCSGLNFIPLGTLNLCRIQCYLRFAFYYILWNDEIIFFTLFYPLKTVLFDLPLGLAFQLLIINHGERVVIDWEHTWRLSIWHDCAGDIWIVIIIVFESAIIFVCKQFMFKLNDDILLR